jgi:hypothetical protein
MVIRPSLAASPALSTAAVVSRLTSDRVPLSQAAPIARAASATAKPLARALIFFPPWLKRIEANPARRLCKARTRFDMVEVRS